MSASQRRKGANGEREFVRAMGALGVESQRNLGQTRDGGFDLQSSLLEESATAVEIKRTESLSFGSWFRKARTPGITTAVAHRGNHSPWRVYVEMTPEDFRDYLQWKARGNKTRRQH